MSIKREKMNAADLTLPPGGSGWMCLFSPQTWELARQSGFAQIAFPRSRVNVAKRMRIGDIIICYLSQRMALSGILVVNSKCSADEEISIYSQAGEFPITASTSPLHILPSNKEVALRPHVKTLAMFRGILTPNGWTVALRRSPKDISRADLDKLSSLIFSAS